MIKLVEEKQIGDVSYFVKDPMVLKNIVKNNEILRSRKTEYNPKTNKQQYYVSLSRNMTSATTRNSERWKYGVIIDGTKLSNRYIITPHSYMGSVSIKTSVRVKYITSYENGTYSLNLVNFPTVPISRTTYERIRQEIENLPEEVKQLKKLQYQQGGRRSVNGTRIKEKYLFNVPQGGIMLTDKTYPDIITMLSKESSLNEQEERIWLKGSEYFININGCVKAVILPKRMKTNPDEFEIELLDFVMNNNMNILWY